MVQITIRDMDKEASDFLKSIASCEQIDEDMWK